MTDSFQLLPLLPLLAQDGADDAQQGSPLTMFMPLILIGVFFYFIILRPQSKERRKHKGMLDALKKNDRVVTVGGIVGHVTNISQDGNEITLRVDDNTRLKFVRSYISSVLTDDTEASA
jgi:preprotein translocase subunit YajC